MRRVCTHILIAMTLVSSALATPSPLDAPGYTDRQGRQSTYQHNEVNEYTGITTAGQPLQTPVHDDAGNLTSNGSGYGFAYDYENRLTRVFVDGNHNGQQDAGETVLADYTYDALGHRVKQVKGGQTTLFYYDGETVLAEYSGTGSLQRYHIHGPTYVDEHVVLHEAGATPAQDKEYYYLLTSLYSVSGLADASGAVVERYRYDAYGMATWPSAVSYGDFNYDGKVDLRDFLIFQAAFSGESPCSEAGRICDSNGDGKVNLEDYRAFDAVWTGSGGSGATSSISPFRFTGQPLDFQLSDPTTGRTTLVLYHYRARGYDAYNGRFLQRDPAEYADSANLYEYVRSQPLTELDSTGRWTYFDILSTTADYGLQAYNAYNTARTIRGYVEEIVAGADLRSVALQAVIDTAVNYAAGKGFDIAIKSFSGLAASFAKSGVGATVRNVAKKAEEQMHHILPKFLGGWDELSNLVPLPKALHKKFTDGFQRVLSAKGIKLSGQKGDTWEKLFEDNPQLRRDAWELLMDYTEDFDKANGTSLFRALVDQIGKQMQETLITK